MKHTLSEKISFAAETILVATAEAIGAYGLWVGLKCEAEIYVVIFSSLCAIIMVGFLVFWGILLNRYLKGE